MNCPARSQRGPRICTKSACSRCAGLHGTDAPRGRKRHRARRQPVRRGAKGVAWPRFSASLGVIRRYGGSAVRRYGGTAKGCTVSEGFGAAGLVSAGFGAVLTAVSAGFDRFRRASAHGQAWFSAIFSGYASRGGAPTGLLPGFFRILRRKRTSASRCDSHIRKKLSSAPEPGSIPRLPGGLQRPSGKPKRPDRDPRRGRARRAAFGDALAVGEAFEEGRMPAAPRSTGSAAPQQSAGPFEEG